MLNVDKRRKMCGACASVRVRCIYIYIPILEHRSTVGFLEEYICKILCDDDDGDDDNGDRQSQCLYISILPVV